MYNKGQSADGYIHSVKFNECKKEWGQRCPRTSNDEKQ